MIQCLLHLPVSLYALFLKKGKIKDEVVPVHTMKAYERDEVQVHTFLTLAPAGDSWSVSWVW
jgi:hypothetical protein